MAASVEVEKMRPNIRIEIPNNLTESEKMDIDQEDENEEGEIVDADDVSVGNDESQVPTSLNSNRIVISSQKNDVFTTGINIFEKEAQDKLQERAKRFALKPEEIHQFSDADLAELYDSLGITVDNESEVRFDAVHLLGVTGITTEDVLEYFAKYAPATIEWINKNSCNVTWLENIAAARAMFYSSKAVRGMPARAPEDVFAKEFLDDIDDQENTGKSILLKNREVELKVEDILPSNKLNFKNSVDISEITIPIPPGYWRLGEKHPKTKCILLRYSLKTDQQPYATENFSKYYKKLGTSKGIISESRKKELKGIFERNKHLNQTKNPWGSLAKNWNQDARFREPERGSDAKIEIKNPSLLVRLGKKKEFPPEDAVEEDKFEEEEEEEDDDVQIVENKPKGRIPRMRMYADEEEEKVRRKKLIQTIKRHTDNLMRTTDLSRTKDLRNVLRMNNKVADDEVIVLDNDSDDHEDLGSRLKNRTRHMVFAVGRDVDNGDVYERKENRSDARHLLDHRRAQSPYPLHSRRSSSRSPKRRYRSRSPIMRYRSPVRRSSGRSSHHTRSYEKTLHSDKMPSRHHHRRRHSVERDRYTGKPRSRVAVVVKKPKKPTVPSTIWSRVRHYSGSEQESSSEEESEESSEESEESSSSSSSSSSSEESESESGSSETDNSHYDRRRKMERPGFRGRSALAIQHKAPLKITMSNDRRRKMERPGFRGHSVQANQHKAPLKITMSNDRYGRAHK